MWARGSANVTALSATIEATDSSVVVADQVSDVEASGSAAVTALNGTRVAASENATVIAMGDSSISAKGSARITAFSGSITRAKEDTPQSRQMKALPWWLENSVKSLLAARWFIAHRGSRVLARAGAFVLAEDGATVKADSGANVSAQRNALVEAENGANVTREGFFAYHDLRRPGYASEGARRPSDHRRYEGYWEQVQSGWLQQTCRAIANNSAADTQGIRTSIGRLLDRSNGLYTYRQDGTWTRDSVTPAC